MPVMTIMIIIITIIIYLIITDYNYISIKLKSSAKKKYLTALSKNIDDVILSMNPEFSKVYGVTLNIKGINYRIDWLVNGKGIYKNELNIFIKDIDELDIYTQGVKRFYDNEMKKIRVNEIIEEENKWLDKYNALIGKGEMDEDLKATFKNTQRIIECGKEINKLTNEVLAIKKQYKKGV